LESGWTAPIDIYCERTDATFWSEPVNAITNAAFLIAALIALLRWRRIGADDWPALALILILTVIGIGSFLFHTFADHWSVLADVIPITIFIYVYFFFALRRFFGMSVVLAVVVTVVFVAASFAFDAVVPRDFLNGSGSYLPALVAILIIGGLLMGKRPDIGGRVLTAGGVFIISVTFRSIDQAVCDALPLGTHFLWHTLNAVTLYILLVVMMRARRPAR
jgi:hypothetical protein